MKQQHYFHLVNQSAWPILAALGALVLTFGATMYMHTYTLGIFILLLGLIHCLIVMYLWWLDVIYEGFVEGAHTSIVQRGLKGGMILFIVSEIMFFAAFFWAFFHSSLAPSIWIGGIWPPASILVFDPWGIPLLNTLILLVSGAAITMAHHYLILGQHTRVEESLLQTLSYAIGFLELQFYEYFNAPFDISDGIYGSTFFMTTGFHGFHVIIGTIFIFVCFLRLLFSQFTRDHHVGFEAAAWYWHFVDVVWLFVFVILYYWGGL
jgi:cytochrome c oxidase subunit 3